MNGAGFTIKELMGAWGCDKAVAYAMMTALVGLGVATEIGVRKTPGVKGAGEKVYRVPEGAVGEFFAKKPFP